jgi:ornithine cyclodeaminase/alanine dehydrogenase-like protein (mu-crystallin family)
MRTLLASHREVASLLPMSECIDIMGDAFFALARGDVQLPLRQVMRLPNSPNLFALMPGYAGPRRSDRHGAALGAKVITVFPGNDHTPYDSHIGVVLLFDTELGRLLAIVDASSITAIRTAAVSGVATRLLASPTAGDVAILGAGVQAMTHLEAMRCVRNLRRVRVWSRSEARRKSFAERATARFGMDVEISATAQDAVREADIICTVTASREPVLQGAWIAEGAHINAVGAALPTARELDSEAVRRARLFVDRRESALNEAGDFLIPRNEGSITDDHLRGELADVISGAMPGRESAQDITLFKSLGLAIEDVVAAKHVYEKSVAMGTGIWVSLGGLRHGD